MREVFIDSAGIERADVALSGGGEMSLMDVIETVLFEALRGRYRVVIEFEGGEATSIH